MAEHKEDSISLLSKALPPFLIEQYERTLAVLNISLPQSFLNTPQQFCDLYKRLDSIRYSFTLPPSGDPKYFALTYTYHILKGLGWYETDFKKFVIRGFVIDPKINELLPSLRAEIISEIVQIIGKLDLQLGNFQCDRYRLVIGVLTKNGNLSKSLTFAQMYGQIKEKFINEWEALAFTCCVLQRSGWGNLKELRLFATPNFTLEQQLQYEKVDLSLVVADYFGNMTDSDFRSAKVLISSLHMNGRRVGEMSIVDFTLLLVNSDIVIPGNVSKIEDKIRYPHYFKKYMKRYEEAKAKRLSQVTQPPQNMVFPIEETVGNPSTTTELSRGMSVPESCTEEEEKTDGGRHAIDMRQPHRPTVDVTTSGNDTNSTGGATVLSDSGRQSTATSRLSYQVTAMSEKGGAIGDTIEDMPVDHYALKLNSSPQLKDTIRLLTPIASKWELIGMCLNLAPEQRPDPSCGWSSEVCLGKVLEEWKRNECSKVTWRNLLDVIENTLHERKIAEDIKNFIEIHVSL